MKELKDTLWKAAEKLRGSVPANQYKDVILGLVFLQFAAEAHWDSLADNAKSPNIGRLVNEAIGAVMAANPALTGTLPQLYHNVDQRRLGELVELLDNARFTGPGGRRARDLMGEVYEYFLGCFARTEGRRGGEFFTPPSVVRAIVEILQPANGRVYDPCCGSGGMFVQTEQFIAEHDGDHRRVSIYGQESVEETWRMARMNLAVHGIDGTRLVRGDTFVRDEHAGVEMNYVMANPPFNIKDWARDESDPRWSFGVPPAGNANFAWIQHILSKLAPRGKAAVVMTNGSMSSNTAGEGDIRAGIVDADLVSCMVALPTQLFRSTGIPVCLWIFDKGKVQRRGRVLFIDARGLGYLVDRAERALTDNEIIRIGDTYRAWYSKDVAYEDVPGFCRSATLDDIRAAGYVLTPGRYVGSATLAGDDEPADEKIARLTTDLLVALDESARLDEVVREQLGRARWR
ncbi:MAG: type restriction enzyme protein [Mycobacterium sp.]|nr:type restriction enzyme protein [Mycobacterium sp.]